MFWFKKKEIVLDCFTSNYFAYEYAKITKATLYYPEWWSKLSGMIDNYNSPEDIFNDRVPTMKYCRGFIDLYKNSFTVPFWGNLKIQSNEDKQSFTWNSNYNIVDQMTLISHNPYQFKNFADNKFQHIKINSPWHLKTKQAINFMFYDPLWNRNNITRYSVLPGVINFKYQHAININLMMEYRDDETVLNFVPGTPIAMMTPITDSDIKIKCHYVSDQEFKNLNTDSRIFSPFISTSDKKYTTTKKFIDNHDERSKLQSKCPFGFGK